MRKSHFIYTVILFILLTMSSSIFAQKEIKKVFEKQEKIKMKLALGSLIINKSTDDKIHVFLEYTYDDNNYEAIFKEKKRYLLIQEKLYGSNPRGYSEWKLAVPDSIKIDFNTGTGDFTTEGINIEIDGNTGTGDIEIIKSIGKYKLNTGTGEIRVQRSEGEFKLNTGTGKVNIESSKGSFNANAGTGDIEAEDITILDDASFNSGTGAVLVKAPKGDDFILTINSGTNDAILDMDGQKLQGYFELTANKRRGRIKSLVKFDNEEEYGDGDGTIIKKSLKRGKKSPEYYISTGTGRAVLKE